MFGLRGSGGTGSPGPGGDECRQNVSSVASSEQRHSRQDRRIVVMHTEIVSPSKSGAGVDGKQRSTELLYA
jgi:hypothetical protein